MEIVQQWFRQQLLGNTVGNLFLFAALLLVGFFLRHRLSNSLGRLMFVLVRREVGSVPLSDFLRLVRKPVEVLVFLLFLYLAFSLISVPEVWQLTPPDRFGLRLILIRLYETTVMLALIWLAIRIIRYFSLIFQKRAAMTESRLDDQLVPFLRDLIILGVCILGGFATLGIVYKVNVVGIITGLGIGGLAIALAARETLENLFASFAILLDRPFVTGDTVTSGTDKAAVTGTVERIGFRSTRLRTDNGSLVAVPNRLMISQTLDNLTDRTKRQSKSVLRLSVDTSPEKLRAIVEEIRLMLATHELTNVEPALVQFDAFGESSRDILVQYNVNTADWREFNQIKEQVNFHLIDIVERNEGQFAFPTRILYLRNHSEQTLEQ